MPESWLKLHAPNQQILKLNMISRCMSKITRDDCVAITCLCVRIPERAPFFTRMPVRNIGAKIKKTRLLLWIMTMTATQRSKKFWPIKLMWNLEGRKDFYMNIVEVWLGFKALQLFADLSSFGAAALVSSVTEDGASAEAPDDIFYADKSLSSVSYCCCHSGQMYVSKSSWWWHRSLFFLLTS